MFLPTQFHEEPELKGIDDELEIIDFLRKYLFLEYEYIFKKELEEIVAESRSTYYKADDFDIRKYTNFVFVNYLHDKLRINMYYLWDDVKKITILFENLLALFTTNEKDYERKNQKIIDINEKYRLFAALISENRFNVSFHKKALESLGMVSLTQDKIDNDTYSVIKDMLARRILESTLMPFYDEYIAILEG